MAEILVKIVRMGFSALAASVGENVAFRFDTLNIVQLPALWATNFDYLFCHIDSFPQFVILTNISDFKLHHYPESPLLELAPIRLIYCDELLVPDGP